jgi:RNA polymerase sigma-70 factor (ECF subfamily)
MGAGFPNWRLCVRLSPKRGACRNLSPMSTESQLLARCLHGDAVAWDELFDLHYAPAGRFVFQLSSDFTAEDVEEICQETFLTVIKSLQTFQGAVSFKPGCSASRANKAHDYRQKQSAAKRGGGQITVSLDAEDPNGFVIDPPASAPGPDYSLINSEDAGLITRALEELGGPCREVIELRYFADLSYEEIAAR